MSQHQPKNVARDWWRERAESRRYVGHRDELPSADAIEVLRHDELIEIAADGLAWVLRTPNGLRGADLVRLNYWALVRVIVDAYAPSAIDRLAAIRLYLGDEMMPATLHLRHARNQSNRTIELMEGSRVVITAVTDHATGTAPWGAPRMVATHGVELPVMPPEWLLLSLTLGDLRERPDLVAVWLRRVAVGAAAIEAALGDSSSSVILKRLRLLAGEVGNTRLAEQLDRVLAGLGARNTSRTLTRMDQVVVPRYIERLPPAREAFVDRQAARFAEFAEQLAPILGPVETRAGMLTNAQVLAVAREAKREDTYHSTTIEGYRITREQVAAVVEGRAVDGTTPDEVERLMALKGYSEAFERTVAAIEASAGPLAMSEELIFDLFEALFWPSVEAGVLESGDLRTWRTRPAFIRGSTHVPPGEVKVPRLMQHYCQTMNALTATPVARAALAHWGFVNIHPFPDGNGRLSRLLMNALLGAAGLPWVTIRAEERTPYFAALERAHTHDDLRVFGQFLRQRIESSIAVIESTSSGDLP